MWRSLLEAVSRHVVLKRRLPARFNRGTLFVSPGAGGLRYWRRDMDKVDAGLLSLVTELVRPSDTVWDIGANVGLFTFAAAAVVGSSGCVLALEPDITLVQLLRRSALTNYHDEQRVKVLAV